MVEKAWIFHMHFQQIREAFLNVLYIYSCYSIYTVGYSLIYAQLQYYTLFVLIIKKLVTIKKRRRINTAIRSISQYLHQCLCLHYQGLIASVFQILIHQRFSKYKKREKKGFDLLSEKILKNYYKNLNHDYHKYGCVLAARYYQHRKRFKKNEN